MSQNQFNNKRYSFFQLFTQGTKEHPGDYQLVIPIIQRDYAQGRDNDKAREVRADFLSQLLDYMTAPSGSHDLDFVYGVSEHAKDPSGRREFVPLDGQQRLTTLFLIHWYLAQRKPQSDPSKRFFSAMRDVAAGNFTKAMFTYRTRRSAAEFCDCLLAPEVDFSQLLLREYISGRLSRDITNSHWFYPEWRQDPTVASMLTMLDAIDERFRDQPHEEMLHRLLSDDPSVTFIFMDLDAFQLTDDLYIKMNSRGMPLTAFENFKAKFEQYISQQQKVSAPAIVELNHEIAQRNHPIITDAKSNFAFNIDTRWGDLFWKYSRNEIKQAEEEAARDDSKNKDVALNSLLSTTLDVKLSNFIKMCLANQFAIDHREDKGRTTIPDLLVDPAKDLSFSKLEDISAISAEGVVYLTRMFDLFCDRPISILPKWASQYYAEREVFEAMMRGKDFGYIPRFRMYAISQFRLKFDDSHIGELVEWARFIYNVTHADNTVEDITRYNYIRAVKNLDLLLDLLVARGDASIMNLLTSTECPEEIEFFPSFQFSEEKVKSHLRQKSKKWGSLVDALESHPYFTGQIGGLLDLAGISDYFNTHGHTNWTPQDDADFMSQLRRVGKIAYRLFRGGYENRALAKDALLERAMLALHPSYDREIPLRPNLLNSTNKRAGSNNILRDMSWKGSLRQFSERPKALAFVKDLFDKIDENDVDGSLRKIVPGHKSGAQWIRDTVTYPYIMGKCTNGFLYRLDDGHRILKSHINLHQEDHEVYSLILWWENIHPLLSDSSWYKNSNASEEIPHSRFRAVIGDKEIIFRVYSRVNQLDGDLLSHYIEVSLPDHPNLRAFLLHEGFYRRNKADTRLRSQEHYMTAPRDGSPQEQREAIARLRSTFARYCLDLVNRIQALQ
ncbi:MAG: DUF262 domain-containing protein [Bacteroidales bacterium]|nr:DUF262 domain-containing protein [Bacteroidales bacterium]